MGGRFSFFHVGGQGLAPTFCLTRKREIRTFIDDYLLFLCLLSFCRDASHGSRRVQHAALVVDQTLEYGNFYFEMIFFKYILRQLFSFKILLLEVYFVFYFFNVFSNQKHFKKQSLISSQTSFQYRDNCFLSRYFLFENTLKYFFIIFKSLFFHQNDIQKIL